MASSRTARQQSDSRGSCVRADALRLRPHVLFARAVRRRLEAAHKRGAGALAVLGRHARHLAQVGKAGGASGRGVAAGACHVDLLALRNAEAIVDPEQRSRGSQSSEAKG